MVRIALYVDGCFRLMGLGAFDIVVRILDSSGTGIINYISDNHFNLLHVWYGP